MADGKLVNDTMANNIEIILNGVNHAQSVAVGKDHKNDTATTKPTISRATFVCLLNGKLLLSLFLYSCALCLECGEEEKSFPLL